MVLVIGSKIVGGFQKLYGKLQGQYKLCIIPKVVPKVPKVQSPVDGLHEPVLTNRLMNKTYFHMVV